MVLKLLTGGNDLYSLDLPEILFEGLIIMGIKHLK